MKTYSSRGRGKLYEAYSREFVAHISYRVNEELATEPRLKKWSGELTLVENMKIRDGGRYMIELEDERKGKCLLKRRINKAVIGVPPRYFYLFHGDTPLE